MGEKDYIRQQIKELQISLQKLYDKKKSNNGYNYDRFLDSKIESTEYAIEVLIKKLKNIENK